MAESWVYRPWRPGVIASAVSKDTQSALQIPNMPLMAFAAAALAVVVLSEGAVGFNGFLPGMRGLVLRLSM